jgi:YVTN family beta-propeller protein
MKNSLRLASFLALAILVLGLTSMPLRAQIVVCNEDGNTITLIDPSTNSILGSITVGGGPSAVAFTPHGARPT